MILDIFLGLVFIFLFEIICLIYFIFFLNSEYFFGDNFRFVVCMWLKICLSCFICFLNVDENIMILLIKM